MEGKLYVQPIGLQLESGLVDIAVQATNAEIEIDNKPTKLYMIYEYVPNIRYLVHII